MDPVSTLHAALPYSQNFLLSDHLYRLHRENDIEDVIENTFSAEDDRFGETITVDLKPGGRDVAVTNENKAEYVQLLVEWRVQRRVEDQFKAFLSGFNELIPQELINVFDERELEVIRILVSLYPESQSLTVNACLHSFSSVECPRLTSTIG